MSVFYEKLKTQKKAVFLGPPRDPYPILSQGRNLWTNRPKNQARKQMVF